jgi:hypothetical protein
MDGSAVNTVNALPRIGQVSATPTSASATRWSLWIELDWTAWETLLVGWLCKKKLSDLCFMKYARQSPTDCSICVDHHIRIVRMLNFVDSG